MAIVKILALVMIVTTMLGAGLDINRQHLVDTLRNVGLLGRALVANVVLVPLFAYAVVRSFHVEADIATGILLMAMAPGVPFLANSAGRKLGGSLAFALEAAIIFSAVSVVTLPISAAVLLPPGSITHVPAEKLLLPLIAFQLIPLIIGVLLSSRLDEKLLVRAGKVLHIAFLASALVLVVLIFPKIIASVAAVYGEGHLFMIAAVGIFSAAVGWLLGAPDRAHRRTLSIATTLRNVGTCMLIGTTTGGTSLLVPTIVAYFIVTFAISIALRVYLKRTAIAPAAAS